jgi:GntR family transcriptional regulator
MQDLQPCLKDKTSPRQTKYAVIQKWLSGQIAAGVFARGQQLPSEHDLMAQFDCSRVTVRQALDNLRRSGMIASQRGKGYFVSRLTAVQDLQRLQSFGEIMAPFGVETSSDVLDIDERDASGDVAEALKICPGTRVTRIERLRIAGNTVVSLDISFFPLDVGERLTRLDLEKEDIFVLLERQMETELGFADLTIDIAPASQHQANLLGVKPKEQVLRIHRLTHDTSGRGIDYERIYARLDAMKFHARLGRW